MASAQSSTNRLIARWSAEGNANDSVGSFSGTLSNATFTVGYSGQAFSFDGTSSVDFGADIGNFGPDDFTISFWMQSTATNESQLIMSKDASCSVDSPSGVLWKIVAGTNSVSLEVDDGDGNATSASGFSPSPLNDGNFHHIAVLRNGVQLAVYIDGVLQGVSTAEFPVDLNNAAAFTLAMGCDSSSPLMGALDEIEIYNRALDNSEIYLKAFPSTTLAILRQPSSQRTLAGRKVIFAVYGVGIEPITYQWQLNGHDIPGANSDTYTIEGVQTTDAGNYSVIISNPTGTTTSQSVSLTVLTSSVTDDAVVARWSGEGDASDSVGTFSGVAYNIKYAPGVVGNAFSFNGKSSIDCGPTIGNFGTNDFSVDFWMQTKALFQEDVLGKRPECSVDNQWDFRFVGDRHFLSFEIGERLLNYASVNSSAGHVKINDNVFHHIAEVRQGSKLKMYVDGILVGTSMTRTPANISNSTPFTMGVGPCDGVDGTHPYVGLLDEVEVFNRALSDVEVYSRYQPDPTLAIITQPHNTACIEGHSVSFTVVPTGLDPFTYQWRYNGQDIAGATDSVYPLSGVQLSDAGLYSVVVSNATESVVSSDARLTVVPSATVLPGLIARWSAEGNADDLVGNSSVDIFNVFYGAGAIGEGFSFNGNNQFILFDQDSGNFGLSDFTIDFWLQTADTSVNAIVLDKETPTDSSHYFDFRMHSGNMTFRLKGDDINSTYSLTTTNSIADGIFHHIAVTRQSTNVAMYVDGAIIASANSSAIANMTNGSYLAVGDDLGFSKRIGGILDELEFYNRSLSASEVQGLYNVGANNPRVAYVAPRDLSLSIGDSFSYTAPTVSSAGPVTYQWQLNGIDIPGATDQTLTIAGISAAGAGNYSVVIQNASGSISCPLGLVSLQLAPGTYNGLFYLDNAPDDTDSGFITLTVTRNLTFSGQIRQLGGAFPFAGQFSGTRALVTNVKRPVADSVTSDMQTNMSILSALTISLESSPNGNYNQIRGLVRNGNKVIPLVAQRGIYGDKNPTPQQGSYTLGLTGVNSPTAPNGHGFGSVTIKPNGLLSVVANLSDDTIVSQGVSVANSGVWPLYVPLYKGRGSLLGWLSFTNTTHSRCEGNIRWIKRPRSVGAYYTNGFAAKIPVIGSTFKASTQGGLGTTFTNSSVVIQGARIYSAQTDRIVSTNRTTITFRDGGTNRVLTVVPSNGQFTGSFMDPTTRQLSKIKGVVLQNQASAYGYFISTNLSGKVMLK